MSSADCRIAPAKRSKKWLLTCARTPPRPSGSPAGEPIAIVTPSGRISRIQLTRARFWPGAASRLIFADQPAAARDQHPAAVEAAHVARDDRAGEAGPGRIERGLEHRRDQACPARPWSRGWRGRRRGCGVPATAVPPPRPATAASAVGRRGRAPAAAGGGAVEDQSRRVATRGGGGGGLAARPARRHRLRHVDDLRRRRRRAAAARAPAPAALHDRDRLPAAARAARRAAAAAPDTASRSAARSLTAGAVSERRRASSTLNSSTAATTATIANARPDRPARGSATTG